MGADSSPATDDANGDLTFAVTPNPSIPAGRSATAMATNAGNFTSEFSAAVTVV